MRMLTPSANWAIQSAAKAIGTGDDWPRQPVAPRCRRRGCRLAITDRPDLAGFEDRNEIGMISTAAATQSGIAR